MILFLQHQKFTWVSIWNPSLPTVSAFSPQRYLSLLWGQSLEPLSTANSCLQEQKVLIQEEISIVQLLYYLPPLCINDTCVKAA